MKKLFFALTTVFSLSIACNELKAQTETIYREWVLIGESDTHLEVSARVIKCHPDSSVQLHVQLFNEGTGNQTAWFKLNVVNPTNNQEMTKEISYSLAQGELVTPVCNKSDYKSLMINLPSGWDPATIKFTLTFIP